MSEADGMDDVIEGGLRQSLLIASRIAETIARRRQESQRQKEQIDTQAAREAADRLASERSTARAALAPVHNDQWWDKAQAADVATMYGVAEGWKDHDPVALAATEKIRSEVQSRYGIDTQELGGEPAALHAGVQDAMNEKTKQDALAQTDADKHKAEVEQAKAMQLVAAATAEDRRAQAAKLAPEMERCQVPAEYLANPELAQALERAHSAKTPKALSAAEATVKERMYLIDKEGINGPDIDQLRAETTANINGAEDKHFADPEFVQAAKDMHEARILAEGGFTGDKWSTQEQRYERAEKELFARIEGIGREIENRVTGNDSSRLKDQSLKAEATSADGYGSAERQEAFAASLTSTGASDSQVRGRAAAERSEAVHPKAAVSAGRKAPKARKSPTGASVGANRSKGGPAK